MKFRLLYIVLLIFGLSIGSSCSRDEDNDHAFTHIELSHYEQFYSNKRELIFYLETLETFPCNNFQINTQVSHNRDQVEIYADNIEIPSYCITLTGPATRNISLGNPDENPQKFSFWVNDDRHDFNLLVKENSIELVPGQFFDSRLSFAREKLMRIPENTVWGYLVYDAENKINLPEELLLVFEEYGAQLLTLSDGDYHYFQVEEETVIFFPGENEITGFSLWFEKEIEILVTAFQKYLAENEITNLQIRLFNTRGERFVF
ncbi:MAG: hypothetical protein K0B37_10165 [Bacteroidales bacterium]|nr:hypothetical protein [Bacteroidales bacterium]